MSIALVVAIALALDYLFKEPSQYHPLTGFGNYADKLEKQFNQKEERLAKGILAWCLAVLPVVAIFAWLEDVLAESYFMQGLIAAIVLYISIGWQSLLDHAQAVIKPLSNGDLDGARKAVSMIVSRDADELDEQGIAKAATESILENGADAIFGSIFWFCLFGIPGVVLYRLSNTLDAMWGYRNQRYRQFGWAAARIDDVLNFFPACLSAIGYAIAGDASSALKHWRLQAFRWKSFNAGTVMAAGAGALNVTLGGDEIYHGKVQKRPLLGPEQDHSEYKPSAKSLRGACHLVNRSLMIWFLAIVLIEALL